MFQLALNGYNSYTDGTKLAFMTNGEHLLMVNANYLKKTVFTVLALISQKKPALIIPSNTRMICYEWLRESDNFDLEKYFKWSWKFAFFP